MTKLIDQINELARKEKSVGLSASEKELQAKLRNEYREQFRANFRQQLDNTYIIDENGNKTKVGKKD